jgi:hypothetical protein
MNNSLRDASAIQQIIPNQRSSRLFSLSFLIPGLRRARYETRLFRWGRTVRRAGYMKDVFHSLSAERFNLNMKSGSRKTSALRQKSERNWMRSLRTPSPWLIPTLKLDLLQLASNFLALKRDKFRVWSGDFKLWIVASGVFNKAVSAHEWWQRALRTRPGPGGGEESGGTCKWQLLYYMAAWSYQNPLAPRAHIIVITPGHPLNIQLIFICVWRFRDLSDFDFGLADKCRLNLNEESIESWMKIF